MLTDYRVRQRDYLLQISRALTSRLDLTEVLRLILESAAEMLSGQAGLIVLWDPEAEDFRVRASYGLPLSALPLFHPLWEDLPRQADLLRWPVPHLDQKLALVSTQGGVLLRRVIGLPMVVGRDVMGAIYIFRARGIRFSSDDLQVLSSFADQAAIAVHNAQLYEAVSREKQRLDAVLEYSADGVMLLDPAHRITIFNRALARLTGWPAEEAIGREHDEVIVWAHLETEMDLARATAGGWPLRAWPPGRERDLSLYVEGDLRRRDGTTVSVGITYAPLFDEEDHLINIIANVRDITRFREADELKATFVSVVSHELKTPVSLIKGYAETLLREDARWDAETVRESLTVIAEEADRLNELIDNLLDASRLEAGALDLTIGEVDLVALAERMVARFRTQTDKHLLVTDFPPDFPLVEADERRIEQVLANLLANAIKYSPQGGRVQISGRVLPDQVIITVSDEGIGIPREEQARIFDRFYRVDDRLSRRTPGTGLGLYLAKAVIEAHGGRIWVESEPGQGAAFSFSLPLSKGRGQEARRETRDARQKT